jgi:hypothetical protein
VREKTPYLISLGAGVLLAAGLLIFQPYSVFSPWRGYTRPVRQYLDAASRRDSIRLEQQSLGTGAVQWALAAARARPDSVADWARHAQAWAGQRRGDTTAVFVQLPNSWCDLVVEFVGPAEHPKVGRASAPCLESR